ncbi:hypothetical protein [Streptomyces nanshensis]|uniref:Uncharacterized protein n=1 Tax=Streptomyces nanshensis TaxID=518642 RepID=A0A1E7L3D5_9ACTN|nr:hypothetical protein [Streptomyces nanshensis]OEV10553.1 hypothetical protein AN218_16990 [Streptomyces nanshensis]
MSTLDDASLAEIRRRLVDLTAMAGVGERPKPTRINGPDESMPGWEWELHEREHPCGHRDFIWVIRTVDEQDIADGLIYLSTPESTHPGEDFVPLYTSDARRIAMALLAAADRAEHQAHGVTRLEDHHTRGES